MLSRLICAVTTCKSKNFYYYYYTCIRLHIHLHLNTGYYTRISNYAILLTGY